MNQFADHQFDVVFSNSVIEHLGTIEDQRRMAREVQRVADRHFVQTPNRYFPIEPHFLFPCFQFLPLRVQVWLLMHRRMGYYDRVDSRKSAAATARSIRLLDARELRALFPGSRILRERFFGITKSLMACGGWLGAGR
jgi:hypothetical protein